jgi:hypothetical protein
MTLLFRVILKFEDLEGARIVSQAGFQNLRILRTLQMEYSENPSLSGKDWRQSSPSHGERVNFRWDIPSESLLKEEYLPCQYEG